MVAPPELLVLQPLKKLLTGSQKVLQNSTKSLKTHKTFLLGYPRGGHFPEKWPVVAPPELLVLQPLKKLLTGSQEVLQKRAKSQKMYSRNIILSEHVLQRHHF